MSEGVIGTTRPNLEFWSRATRAEKWQRRPT